MAALFRWDGTTVPDGLRSNRKPPEPAASKIDDAWILKGRTNRCNRVRDAEVVTAEV
ncbi:MAG: hypothetical protein WBC44_04065 [Planctomycetaceae bacterium]